MSILWLIFNPVTVLFMAVVWMLRDENDRLRVYLVIALSVNLFHDYFLTVVLGRVGGLLHWKYDYFLSRMDSALGMSAAGVALFFGHPWWVLFAVIYEGATIMAILWIWVNRHHNVAALIRAYIVELAAAPFLYAILPACGPAYAFRGAWTHPPAVQMKVAEISGLPNAFPSLHLATAFLLVLTAKNKLWRAVSAAFLVGTALATLTTGEHYVIDLVAGLAFGCFLVSVGNLRAEPAAAYLALTLGWSIGIRIGVGLLIAHPLIVRLSATLTMLIAAYAVWTEWHAVAGPVRADQTVPAPSKASLPAMPLA